MSRDKQLPANLEIPEVVNGSGLLALFLQFAHPLVAAGLASTGEFYRNPKQRLQRTAKVMAKLTTGGEEEVKRLSLYVAKQHAAVRGELSENVGPWKAGTAYTAADSELLLWVYATLVVSRIHVFSTFIRPLSQEEQEAYYRSTFPLGECFGINKNVRPATYNDLEHYFESMLGRLAVGKEGTQLANSLVASLEQPSIIRLAITGLLPHEVRQAYGFSWNWRRNIASRMCGVALMKSLALQRTFSK